MHATTHHAADHLELVRDARNFSRYKALSFKSPVNPSVLVDDRPDDPNCTHHLFRQPKTGSTALWNAAMTDARLHRRVCWHSRVCARHQSDDDDDRRRLQIAASVTALRQTGVRGVAATRGPLPRPPYSQRATATTKGSAPTPPFSHRAYGPSQGPCGMHEPPPPSYPWPVIVTLRHPLILLESHLAYLGWDLAYLGRGSNASSPLVLGGNASLSRVLASSFGDIHAELFVPVRHPSEGAIADVVLCTGMEACPALDAQLREALHDPLIQDIPFENVNHRERTILSERPLASYVAPEAMAVWQSWCGKTCRREAVPAAVTIRPRPHSQE